MVMGEKTDFIGQLDTLVNVLRRHKVQHHMNTGLQVSKYYDKVLKKVVNP